LGLLHIEFEPTVAVRLQQDADRAFLLSSISALVLMLLAAALWWQLRRREAVAAATERERRLAQLGEMSAVLAHEMRNPLASLKGHAQLLLEQLSAGTREAKKAERIVSEAGRLETLSRTLLDFIRSGTIERRRVDATALIQEAVDEFEADQIRLDVHGKVERKVSLDPLRIHQVIVNLLQNALEATSDPEPVEVSLEIGSGTFKVTVRDRGPGLPADADKIFEAFHTDKVQGTGLGLAIARRIVELHDGTLTAENHPDGGALFVLEARG
jgi:two-component system sensor histidine kinase HydH